MNKDIVFFAILFVTIMLLQILVCNHIALFNVAIPIVFIYFIIRLPISLNTSFLLTLSFLAGFIIDIFSDTLGVNSLACTFLAVLKKPVFFAYVDKDDRTKDLLPSVATLGIGTYSKYLFSMIIIYCLLVFSIEYFNFANVKDIVILSASSCTLTFIVLLATDCLILSKR